MEEFEKVAKEWLFEHKKSNVKESTFEQIEVIVCLHALPYFNKRIMSIHRPKIKRWITKFGEINKEGNEKYSFGSRLKYLSVFDGNKITINKQTRRIDNNEVKITTLKNSSSYRTIQMEEELVRE